MKKTLSGVILLLLTFTSANAALISRLSGQAYYDTVLDITWLADANRAKTSGYDADGLMTWSASQTWIGTLNTASYLGVSDWRLPTVTDTGTSGCNFAYTGTDCGYNVGLSTGEMARMFYSTLGNVGAVDASNIGTGCLDLPTFCLTNTGPFSNLQPLAYWSGTEYAPATSGAWRFGFGNGLQGTSNKANGFYAWAVRPGDIALVPVPGAVWLFGGALTLLGFVRRRSAACYLVRGGA